MLLKIHPSLCGNLWADDIDGELAGQPINIQMAQRLFRAARAIMQNAGGDNDAGNRWARERDVERSGDAGGRALCVCVRNGR